MKILIKKSRIIYLYIYISLVEIGSKMTSFILVKILLLNFNRIQNRGKEKIDKDIIFLDIFYQFI